MLSNRILPVILENNFEKNFINQQDYENMIFRLNSFITREIPDLFLNSDDMIMIEFKDNRAFKEAIDSNIKLQPKDYYHGYSTFDPHEKEIINTELKIINKYATQKKVANIIFTKKAF